MFVYEVVGLRQNQETDKMNYPIRRSGSVFVTVPYSRMNQEMQRITRMGGKIVSIQPLTADNGAKVKATPRAEPEAEPKAEPQQQSQKRKASP
jgi:ferredoxin--NADP+ reductase